METDNPPSDYQTCQHQTEIILASLLAQLSREVKTGPESDSVAGLLKSVQALEKLNAVLEKLQKKEQEIKVAQRKKQSHASLSELDWEILARHIQNRGINHQE